MNRIHQTIARLYNLMLSFRRMARYRRNPSRDASNQVPAEVLSLHPKSGPAIAVVGAWISLSLSFILSIRAERQRRGGACCTPLPRVLED